MKKPKIPDGLSPESLKSPEQESLHLLLSEIRELARDKATRNVWTGSHKDPATGQIELAVVYLENGDSVVSEDGRIKGIVKLIRPARREFGDAAPSQGDEQEIDEYDVFELERGGDTELLKVRRREWRYSESKRREVFEELARLEEENPQAAAEFIESLAEEKRLAGKAERRASEKGAGEPTEEQIHGLATYLQQFIDELRGKSN